MADYRKYFIWFGFIFAVFFGLNLFLDKFVFLPVYYSSGGKETEILAIKEKSPIHLKTPDAVRAIYLTSYTAGFIQRRDELVKFADESEINSVVIDIKDYSGRIAFEMDDLEIRNLGSIEKRIPDIKEFIDELHKKDIYAIGRIAVFQDPYLAKVRPDLAVKNKKGGVWLDHKGIAWLDPTKKDVWDYHIKIAKQAEKAGFDELNFDYVRFPSDGKMDNIAPSFILNQESRVKTIEDFFRYLKTGLSELKIPLSVDLFGFTTTETNDLNIGQVLEKTEPYFDYIAPMVYPSHYPNGYNNFKNPAEHPYEIIFEAMTTAADRLIKASSTPSKLRPWIQDFDLGATYNAAMIKKQKQAIYDAGLNSWMAWDPANKYTREAYIETNNN